VSTQPPEPPPGEGAPPADAAADERRCPRCTAPYEPLQEYCLECGQRLVPLPSESYARTVVWSRESPIWLWIALLALLLVALAAGAIVALAATDDDEPAAAASSNADTIPVGPPPTGTITVDPPSTIDSTITIPTDTFPTTSTFFPTTTFQTTTFPTGTTSTTTTGGGGTIMSWPSGRDGFTVVLKSTPVGEGRGPAESAGQQAINRGLPEVGILTSSDYSTLNPGFYVTFTGVYDSQNEAENALPRARSSGFPTAYVREVAD
jgi:hypothetical protein